MVLQFVKNAVNFARFSELSRHAKRQMGINIPLVLAELSGIVGKSFTELYFFWEECFIVQASRSFTFDFCALY